MLEIINGKAELIHLGDNTYNWTGSLTTFGSDQVTLAEIPANTSNVSFNVVMDGDLESSDDNIDIEVNLSGSLD